jgi:hypothetical protein
VGLAEYLFFWNVRGQRINYKKIKIKYLGYVMVEHGHFLNIHS